MAEEMTQEELDALYADHPEFKQTPSHLAEGYDPVKFYAPVFPSTAPQPPVYAENVRTEEYQDPAVADSLQAWEEQKQGAAETSAPVSDRAVRSRRRAAGSETQSA